MRHLACTLLATALLLLTASVAAAQSTLPPGFEEVTLIDGLTRPTVVDWTPDGRTVVSEQDGRLKVANPGQDTAQTVLDITAQVNSGGDRGLLGMAVDSDFASNGYVYLLHTYELGWQTKTPAQRDTLSPMVSRLLRVKLEADNDVSEQTTILGSYDAGTCPVPSNALDCMPSNSDSHAIGTVRSAPDGTLFLGAGDASSYSGVDQLAFRTYDEQSLAGKIIHIDRDGRGVPGHPFCPANANLDDVCTKLWAKGFRNPFRFVLSPADGLILGDVGWGRREEIDLISTGGGNYGWPCVEGTQHNNPYGSDPKCQSSQFGPYVYPYYDYPQPEGGNGAAVVAGPRYEGGEYPVEYQGAIVFGDYVRGVLRRLDASGPGAPVERAFAGDWYGNVDIESAPDNGDIVFVSYGDAEAGGGSIERISYSPGNARPVARAEASPTASPTVPMTVQFDGSTSSDADPGDTLGYSWDFGDGETSDAVAPSHQYDEPGSYDAVLTVDDGRGKSDSDSVTITAGNTPPDKPQVDRPAGYRGGGTIALSGTATDDQDGQLGPESLTWDVTLVHSDHDHPFFHDRAGDELEFTDPASHDADSYYEIKLTATDAGGLRTTTVVELVPETTTITLASEPPGAPLSYYDATFAAPVTRPTAIGLQTGVGAAERFTVGGQEYVFQSWSDGGERNHPLTVPETPTTLVARYGAVAGPPTPPDLRPGPDETRPTVKARGPKVALTTGRRLAPWRTALRGTATDADGVARVFGAVYRAAARGRCRFWSPRARRLQSPTSCKTPAWIKATLSGPSTRREWRLALGAPLPKGGYRLRMRAHDRDGTVATTVDGARSLRLRAR
jgi:glucose/arabinose dehydrogenase